MADHRPEPLPRRRLLICADSGGSNGARIRAWKIELANLAEQTGLAITVCHLPPGTSKWNKIEHRLFSQITRNWAGRPLRTHQTIVDLIAATTTTTGLSVHCVLDTGEYPTGLRYTKKEVETLPLDPPRLPRRVELHTHPARHAVRTDTISSRALKPIGLRNVSLTRSALLPACLEAATELRQNPAI